MKPFYQIEVWKNAHDDWEAEDSSTNLRKSKRDLNLLRATCILLGYKYKYRLLKITEEVLLEID